ncbi:transcription antitermination factor NusB [Pseudobacillus badius]|uniref:transcription antitermination factor NusB n=1 Tax=Bacillus badius TaxID=1455 RepID=UPI0007B06425|nr:transcription antitermination factor NusB [Bacillus badius]KZN98868.1 N utilization substance protein B [Bacillus badius]MED0664790.1 transcription antitermination factor NusB [Bacillus badius]OCS83805.1 transcription antitermination factor NusB [Bacillus badius]OVE52904.1 transcription antitermination factor NusB [Bacillus badius]TDW04936.1 NusB antitermination factor [Bacillus badius]
MKRRTAREKSLQALYQIDVSGAEPEAAITNVLEEGPADEYLHKSVIGTIEHREEIDELIKAHLEKWSFDRLAKVDRNILRLAVFEMKYGEDVPEKVAINEAIELAKQFSDEQSGKFINGVLSRIKESL